MAKRKRTAQSGPIALATQEVTSVVESTLLEAPRTRRVSLRSKVNKAVVVEDNSNREDSPLTEVSEEEYENKPTKKSSGKRKRRKMNDEPVVYDIPPVKRKYTNFKGRLGYACLNTVLRALKPDSIFCSRTCRLETIRKNGIEFAKDLGLQNCRDLYKLIEWNEENQIRFLRISSEMFPFASHKEHGYDLSYAKDELKRAGDLASRLGHRLTTHPGQFTQLASPREAVVEASVRELDYHCQMMRYMGLGKDSVIIIHMGGVYGDKEGTLQRFKENYTTKLTDEMKARLVLENDEMCYNPDELLPVCNELNIPIVFDYHHNWINPSVRPVSELIPMLNETWLRKGIKPKQHLSSPRPGCENGSVMEKRAHADRCYTLPDELVLPPQNGSRESTEVDLMIEAKDKEQAVFLLYRIYDLAPVKHENLRPEKLQKAAGATKDGGEELEALVEGDAIKNADYSPKRGRRTRNNKALTEAGPSEPDTGGVADTSGPAQRKGKNRGRSTKAVQAADPGTNGSEMNVSGSQDLTTLTNQEEAPIPIDNGDIATIDAEEHPEAVLAAAIGEGCGVKRSIGKTTKNGRRKKRSVHA